MLEPVLRPRTGRLLWVLGGAIGALSALMDTGVSTETGYYPLRIVGVFVVALAAVRVAGISAGLRQKTARMPWGYRILSWVVFLVPLAFLGAFASPVLAASALGLCALDALGGLATPKGDVPSDRANRLLARLKVPLLLAVGGIAFALFHFLWSSKVEGGHLLDWAFLSVLFALVLRYALLPARRGAEEAAFPPPEARTHERRSRPLPDPARDAVLKAAGAFRKSGAVEPILATVEGFGVPGLAAEARTLLARPGTTREDDLAAVASLVERRLAGEPDARPRAVRVRARRVPE